ncbi:hypothetical protein X548_02960 [Stenotrophomonas maltophilia 5BA-I-2]|nr:hypothetical protein X548_02960 [Stenotrophomonas maltophilia 5BA-I-2]
MLIFDQAVAEQISKVVSRSVGQYGFKFDNDVLVKNLSDVLMDQKFTQGFLLFNPILYR